MTPRAAIASMATAILLAGCATDGTVGTATYGAYYYDDAWYGGGWYAGCCADYPGDIGPPPPRPEHPIANPPGGGERPSQPIATPRSSMPSPRPSASMGGGGRGGGGRR